MFTGIVTATAPIVEMSQSSTGWRIGVALDEHHRDDLKTGASVAVSGICLTVSEVNNAGTVAFDLSTETLARTTAKSWSRGTKVNIERSAKPDAEIGGHILSGHIDGECTVTAINKSCDYARIDLNIPQSHARFLFDKGYIGLDGCSLTICEPDRKTGNFFVSLIPETLRLTTFDFISFGDMVNFEIDRQTQILVDTIRESLREIIREELMDFRLPTEP